MLWCDISHFRKRVPRYFAKFSFGVLAVLAANIAVSAEYDLGVGYEPVVTADRMIASTDTTKRVQVVWTTADTVRRTYSNNLGVTWVTSVPFGDDTEVNIDPIAACNLFGAQSPRHMYFGWYTE